MVTIPALYGHFLLRDDSTTAWPYLVELNMGGADLFLTFSSLKPKILI